MNKEKLYNFLVSGLGAGYLPKSPGTFGTISALAVYVLLVYLFGLNFQNGNCIVYFLCIYSVFIGTYLTNKVLEFKENENVKDPQFIVIDEWGGFFISILFSKSLIEVFVGFFLFRMFDIWKPWLVGKAENLPRGYGVMADDIVAGIFSLFFMCLIFK